MTVYAAKTHVDMALAGKAAVDHTHTGGPAFDRVQTVAQSIPTGLDTIIVFDAVANIDTSGGWSSTSTYTIPQSGIWSISYGVDLAANATGERYARLTLNGTTSTNWIRGTVTSRKGSTEFAAMVKTRVLAFNAGDVLRLQCFQNSGAALNTAVGSDVGSHLSGFWIRP